jgi:alpha-beta hydrolase superfamily lysophospholipase
VAEPTRFELSAPGVGSLAAYRWEAPGTGRPLVVVHGYAEHALRHGRLAEAAAAAGHPVVAVDLPGHGRSPGPRALVRSYAPLVAAVGASVDAATALGRGLPVLFGHSMGGAVALAYALERPAALERLVLSAPYLLDPVPRPGWMTALAGALAAALPTLPVARLDSGALAREPRVGADYVADPLVHSGPVAAVTGHTLIAGGRELLARAGSLAVPTLVLHGEADRVASPEGSRRLAADAPPGTLELVKFPGAYHELHNEPADTGVPGRFFASVLAFLAGQAAGASAEASRASASSSTS